MVLAYLTKQEDQILTDYSPRHPILQVWMWWSISFCQHPFDSNAIYFVLWTTSRFTGTVSFAKISEWKENIFNVQVRDLRWESTLSVDCYAPSNYFFNIILTHTSQNLTPSWEIRIRNSFFTLHSPRTSSSRSQRYRLTFSCRRCSVANRRFQLL